MAKPKKLMEQLAVRGPHTVFRGNLALAGQPGVVYTPAEGFNLPGVAFGHGWLLSSDNYTETLRHLASWGIVAAAPDTERGPVPSHLGLATDLGTVLDIMTGVRLGNGNISVHPNKLAVAGHGMGAGAAVLAASRRHDVKCVAALFPAPTAPRSEDAAAHIDADALILTAGEDEDSFAVNASSLAEAWGGKSVLRSLDKATSSGLVEGRRLLAAVGVGGAEKSTQKLTRAILTAFLLFQLTGDNQYEELAGASADFKNTTVIDPHAPKAVEGRSRPSIPVRALLGR